MVKKVKSGRGIISGLFEKKKEAPLNCGVVYKSRNTLGERAGLYEQDSGQRKR